MFRFTIRDVFWFVLLVALLLAWWREGLNLDSEKRTLENDIRTAFSARDQAVYALRTNEPYYVAEGWHTVGDPDHYELGLDADIRHSGEFSAFIKAFSISPGSYASLTQSIRADEFRGKRLRLSAYLKTESVTNTSFASFFVGSRLNTEDPYAASDRQVQGTVDWKRYDLVLDIPADATLITFGIQSHGGMTWVDDLQLEVVGPEVPETFPTFTYVPTSTQPRAPRNVRFPTEPLSLDFKPPAAKR